jgi:hypothetical protein
VPKKIMPDHSIYVASDMLGMYIHGDPKVIDQTTGITLDPYNLEDRISIYERQVFGWFIDPAVKLIELINVGAAFIVLSICFSYLEGV